MAVRRVVVHVWWLALIRERQSRNSVGMGVALFVTRADVNTSSIPTLSAVAVHLNLYFLSQCEMSHLLKAILLAQDGKESIVVAVPLGKAGSQSHGGPHTATTPARKLHCRRQNV